MKKKPSREQYLSEINYINQLPIETDTELNPFRKKNNSFFEFLRVNFYYICVSLPKYLIYLFKFREDLKRLYKLKNNCKGKKVILLGGGESLDELTQDKVKRLVNLGYEFITLNNYSKYVDLTITSNHIVLSDPGAVQRVIKDSLDYISLDTNIYFPCSSNLNKFLLKNKDLLSRFNKKNIHFFIDNEIKGFGLPISPLLPRNYSSMTAYKALSLAMHLGYSKIYLLGLDNTYIRNTYVNNKNEIMAYVTRSKTFSGVEYNYKAIKPFFNSISEWILDIYRLFEDLNLFYDKKHPKRIINLDEYSLVDTFPKIDIETLLEEN